MTDRETIISTLRALTKHVEWKYFNGPAGLFSTREPTALQSQLKKATKAAERLDNCERCTNCDAHFDLIKCKKCEQLFCPVCAEDGLCEECYHMEED